MIVSIAELKMFVTTDKDDPTLEFMIQSVESFIKVYTNNTFKNRETGIEYFSPDLKMGAINLIQYDLNMRDKTGLASETISRHSQSFTNQDSANAGEGYPGVLMGFLKPYVKARF